MGFLDKILGKKEAPIQSNTDFWNWFLQNEKEFFKIVKSRQNIHQGFLEKLAPKLDEIHSGIYFLTGMFDDNTVELILTPDGAIRNIYAIEELVNAAPQIEGWKITALKPSSDIQSSWSFRQQAASARQLQSHPLPDCPSALQDKADRRFHR